MVSDSVWLYYLAASVICSVSYGCIVTLKFTWQVQAKYCGRNIYIGGHFLSVREGETARKGLRTTPRSLLVVFLPTALCSTAYKLEVT